MITSVTGTPIVVFGIVVLVAGVLLVVLTRNRD